MANEMRDRLVELLNETFDAQYTKSVLITAEHTADHLIENGVGIFQWISVDDRLPEDKQSVLTIDSESKMEVCFYEREWKGVFQQCGGLVKIFNVTHWMPLPEPPKAEQKLKEMRGAEMDKQDLYNLEIEVHKNIDIIKNEQAEYVRGVERGIDLMFDAVRKHLTKEAEKEGAEDA